MDDAITVDEDADATVVDVLGNDTDTDGGPKNVTGVTQPAHGTVKLTDGTITYTPDADYNGSDSFTYTISTAAPPATVTVTVADRRRQAGRRRRPAHDRRGRRRHPRSTSWPTTPTPTAAPRTSTG